jgi:hypothetical protein
MKTKNISSLLAALALVALAAPNSAHAQAFDRGVTAINAGIGLGGARYSYISSYNDNYKTSPTIVLSIEHGVGGVDGVGAIGVGGLFANKTVSYKYTSQGYQSVYNYDRRWSNTVVGLRGTLHLNEIIESDKFDVYGGLMLGYNIGSYKDKMSKKVHIESYGCQMNHSDSEIVASILAKDGYTPCSYSRRGRPGAAEHLQHPRKSGVHGDAAHQ